ncbi:hypothetical protein [Pedosphaera parvula]|uniref:hypothetical protein n=1 Tax=Pedosphaera parvula TaxID=1032527 RepID=UPI0002EE88B9|nr:hypothetical protein [Pedosphaera parvula]
MTKPIHESDIERISGTEERWVLHSPKPGVCGIGLVEAEGQWMEVKAAEFDFKTCMLSEGDGPLRMDYSRFI